VNPPVAVDRPPGRHKGLARDLATEHPLPPRLRAQAAKDVLIYALEIEESDQPVHCLLTDDSLI
jgi:hypothetical protein